MFRQKNGKAPAIEATKSVVFELTEYLGPGTEVLSSESIGGVGSALLRTSGKNLLTRRSDGSLDQVFVFMLEWTPPNVRARRFLCPLRLHRSGDPSAAFFTHGTNGED